MINYLVKENYVIESFTYGVTPTKESSNITHTIDLPLTTKTTCNNFCGPNAKCAMSGQQCFSDIDCPGCQPESNTISTKTTDCVPANNAAGKLTIGVTPSYSSLTNGYGTQERIVTEDLYSKAPQPDFGVDTWSDSSKEAQQLFDRRYKPNILQFMPKYPEMYSLTGMYKGDGPMPSNY